MTWPTSAPRGRSRPKASANCAFTSWICTPMRPRVTLPVLTSCCAHVVGHVDRDGERDAHVAAAAAVDLRVDADDFAVEIEQRAAGVAGIHRDVGLDERHEAVFARHGAAGGADDARGDAVLERERRADGEHPLTRTQLRRIADAHHRQVLAFDLDDRDVGAAIEADDLGGVFAPVGHAHRDFIRVGDHVRIGEDVAVGADDEARAFTLALRDSKPRRPPPWSGAECRSGGRIPDGIFGIFARTTDCAHAMRFLDHRHVDDGRTDLFDQRGEIRQHAAIQRADGLRRRRRLRLCSGAARGCSTCACGAARRTWENRRRPRRPRAATSKASRNE